MPSDHYRGAPPRPRCGGSQSHWRLRHVACGLSQSPTEQNSGSSHRPGAVQDPSRANVGKPPSPRPVDQHAATCLPTTRAPAQDDEATHSPSQIPTPEPANAGNRHAAPVLRAHHRSSTPSGKHATNSPACAPTTSTRRGKLTPGQSPYELHRYEPDPRGRQRHSKSLDSESAAQCSTPLSIELPDQLKIRRGALRAISDSWTDCAERHLRATGLIRRQPPAGDAWRLRQLPPKAARRRFQAAQKNALKTHSQARAQATDRPRRWVRARCCRGVHQVPWSHDRNRTRKPPDPSQSPAGLLRKPRTQRAIPDSEANTPPSIGVPASRTA